MSASGRYLGDLAWPSDLTRDDPRHDVILSDREAGVPSPRAPMDRGPIKRQQRFVLSSVWKRLGLVVFLALSAALAYIIVTGVLSGGGPRRISHADVYHHPDQNADATQLRCIRTTTDPEVDICVYNAEDDTPVSAELISTGNWQPSVTKLFQRAMRNYPSCDVIDLGAHIGFYTLLAAKTNHRVLAVEPVLSSLRRIHHAALLSGLRRNITLFHHAIYNDRTEAWLRQPMGNIGGSTIVINDSEETEGAESVKTVLLNDLFPYIQRRIVIIKIDIGGFECRAISSATQLFSGAHMPYIFMAWKTMHEKQDDKNSACVASNIERMTIFLAHRGYVPYLTLSGEQLNWRHSVTWNCTHVTWRHVSAQDLRDPPPPTTLPPDADLLELEEGADYAYSLW